MWSLDPRRTQWRALKWPESKNFVVPGPPAPCAASTEQRDATLSRRTTCCKVTLGIKLRCRWTSCTPSRIARHFLLPCLPLTWVLLSDEVGWQPLDAAPPGQGNSIQHLQSFPSTIITRNHRASQILLPSTWYELHPPRLANLYRPSCCFAQVLLNVLQTYAYWWADGPDIQIFF